MYFADDLRATGKGGPALSVRKPEAPASAPEASGSENRKRQRQRQRRKLFRIKILSLLRIEMLSCYFKSNSPAVIWSQVDMLLFTAKSLCCYLESRFFAGIQIQVILPLFRVMMLGRYLNLESKCSSVIRVMMLGCYLESSLSAAI